VYHVNKEIRCEGTKHEKMEREVNKMEGKKRKREVEKILQYIKWL